MTCEELRSHFEVYLRDSEFLPDRAAAEHLLVCPDCGRFVEEQRALARVLTGLRETVDPVPKSLDDAVLSRYRQFTTKASECFPTEIPRPPILQPVWVWSALAVAALVAGSLWFSLWMRPAIAIKTPAPSSPAAAPVAKIELPVPVPHSGKAMRPRPLKASRSAQATAEAVVDSSIRRARSLPEGFRSLMYCDPLSCPEDMEMIRVQLPSSALPRHMSGFIRTSGSVTADVLVGPDGYARGIRLEEIEF